MSTYVLIFYFKSCVYFLFEFEWVRISWVSSKEDILLHYLIFCFTLFCFFFCFNKIDCSKIRYVWNYCRNTVYSFWQDRSNQYYSKSPCLQGSVGGRNRKNARSYFGWSTRSKRIWWRCWSVQKRFPRWTYTDRNFKFMFPFLQSRSREKKALTTGKRQREIGLVVPVR